MDPDRLARLTEQQRACLRFVFARMAPKDIAPHLGLAPDGVEREIRAAMRTLGTGDRRAAARMLAEHEGAVREPPAVVAAPTEAALALREEQAEFAAMPASPPGGGRKWLAWIVMAGAGAVIAYAVLR